MIAPFVTPKRPIIEVEVNSKKAYMLVDTGATIGVVDIDKQKEYGFNLGSSISGGIVGIGGNQPGRMHHTKGMNVSIAGVSLHQFATTDISSIVSSIKNDTGIEIFGIIGFEQMKQAEIKVMVDEGYVKIGF